MKPWEIFCKNVYLFNFQFRARRWRILSHSTKPRVHGSHWQVLCQPDRGGVPDGGGQQGGGGGGAGVRVLQLPLRDDRGEHQLQRQHLPALRLHHVQAAADTLTTRDNHSCFYANWQCPSKTNIHALLIKISSLNISYKIAIEQMLMTMLPADESR